MKPKKTDDAPKVTLAHSLAVLRPVSITEGKVTREIGWQELTDRLRVVWRAAGRLMNRAMALCARLDDLPDHGCSKMPPLPDALKNLYGQLITEGGPQLEKDIAQWIGASTSVNCLIRKVGEKYKRERAAIWLHGKRSLPSFRERDYAYPVHNANWKAEQRGTDLFVSFPLPALDVSAPWLADRYRERYPDGLPPGRVTLQLRASRDRGRQIAALRKVISGEAKQHELSVYQQPGGGSKTSHDDRGPGGHQRQPSRLMVRFICTSARPERRAENTLLVRTCSTAFLVTEMDGWQEGAYRKWTSNADHMHRVRHLIERYTRWRERLSLDRSRERRVSPQQKRQMNDALERRQRKQEDRITSVICQEVASLAGYCERQRVARVIYDDREKGYFPSFPWARLKDRLKLKLQSMGLQFASHDDDPEEGDDECDLSLESIESLARSTRRAASFPRPRTAAARSGKRPAGS